MISSHNETMNSPKLHRGMESRYPTKWKDRREDPSTDASFLHYPYVKTSMPFIDFYEKQSGACQKAD